MKWLKIVFRRETAIPVMALVFASAVCVTLVLARIVWTMNVRYAFLVWNLFLAWIPLILAMVALEQVRRQEERGWRFAATLGTWLLFFPNAPYIFTDLIHLTRGRMHFWVDMVLILCCAMTGLVLGFLSLYLIQGVVRRKIGGLWSWVFIATVTALGGFGICIGRFLRLNSWDLLARPLKLYHGIGGWVTNPLANSTSLAFGVLFTAFLFIAYVMLYALTHLPPGNHIVEVSVGNRRGKEAELILDIPSDGRANHTSAFQRHEKPYRHQHRSLGSSL